MAHRNTPRWLVVWKYVAGSAIVVTLIWTFVEPSLGHSRPEREWSYPIRVPRSQDIYYVTPTVGLIHRAAPLVAFSLMVSFVLAAVLVDRHRRPLDARGTVETIASAPFSALVTYLVGLCVCFLPFAAGIVVRSAPFLIGAWTVYWISTIAVVRRRRRHTDRSDPNARKDA